MRGLLPAILLILAPFGCTPTGTVEVAQKLESEVIMAPKKPVSFDFQGHRGCRGILPENTIAGFVKALDLGVTTLEMDVVITSDEEVILSHEPWFSHEICTGPDGTAIGEADERTHRIYGMTFAETQAYDCGMRRPSRFPGQVSQSATKPLLREVIAEAEIHAINTGRAMPFYNIETKCTPDGDGTMHPTPDVFARLVMEQVLNEGVSDRTTIQSFDVRSLQYLHGKFPEVRLALLIENAMSPQENLDELGFTPHIYSPYFLFVTPELVDFCRKKNMLLIPWTVNEADQMQTLIDMGVDGLISDYPDRFSPLRH